MLYVLALTTLMAAIPADNSPLSGAEIESLIEKLASPNEAPTRRGPSAKYPEGYDRDAQKRVKEAWGKLWKAELQAFPYLFKHFDDERYSFTMDGGFVDENWTVGRACSDIVKCYLQPFGYRPYARTDKSDDRGRPIGALRPSYVSAHRLHNSMEAAKWLAFRQHKTLLELQIEVIEWTIAKEAKNPDDYTDKERAYLDDFLTRARNADRPLAHSVPFAK
jgi:hypothetical protein